MRAFSTSLSELGQSYVSRLKKTLDEADWPAIEKLGEALLDCWKSGSQVFLCGNGGSAGNAVHIANDFIFGISKRFGSGLNVHALTANGSVVTCLANDLGYESIFSYPLGVQGRRGDVLIALSGSGNSPNILEALKTARDIGMRSFAILGYSGGKAKELADTPIHFAVDDMQISEDLQLIVAHMAMQWLYHNRQDVFDSETLTARPDTMPMQGIGSKRHKIA